MCDILEIDSTNLQENWRQIVTLPLHGGGLGLRSATKLGVAAHWASWADSLEMIQKRHPEVANRFVSNLKDEHAQSDCLWRVAECRHQLQGLGMEVPEWSSLAEGARPGKPPAEEEEPGFFKYGWQHVAAKVVDDGRRSNCLEALDENNQAHLRSQSGPGAGAALCAIPTSKELRIEPHLFRTILLRRLRQPLPISCKLCKCHRFIDPLGDHLASCATCGVLVRRSYAQESAVARVFREAGGRVRSNVLLRDLNISRINLDDGRKIEVIVDGLSLYHGKQLAVDATIVGALGRNGKAHKGCSEHDGIAMTRARTRKENKYPELLGRSSRAKLVVFAMEVGGWWSPESWKCLAALARGRARDVPDILRVSAAAAWQRRWSCLLAVAVQRAVACTLLGEKDGGGVNGELATTADVLEDARHA